MADRARAMAARIEALPEIVCKSFTGGRSVADRVTLLTGEINEIMVGLHPVVSWLERRTHPNTAGLEKQRLLMVLNDALAVAKCDIPGYATDPPQQASESEQPCKGEMLNARLAVEGFVIAGFLRNYAEDIEAEERQRDRTRQAIRPVEGNWLIPMSLADMANRLGNCGTRKARSILKSYGLHNAGDNRQLWTVRLDGMPANMVQQLTRSDPDRRAK